MDFSFDGNSNSDSSTASSGIVEPPLTAAAVEKSILEQQPEAPKKRGRKPGSTNKTKESAPVPEYVKIMFGPIVVATHNMLLKVLKLSAMDKEQEKMVTDGYAMLLHKRIPTLIENHGDIIAAVGSTTFVFMAKFSSETNLFNFTKEPKQNGKTEQHNNDHGQEGEWKDSIS